jgi:hypothetical protein
MLQVMHVLWSMAMALCIVIISMAPITAKVTTFSHAYPLIGSTGVIKKVKEQG